MNLQKDIQTWNKAKTLHNKYQNWWPEYWCNYDNLFIIYNGKNVDYTFDMLKDEQISLPINGDHISDS